MFNRLITVAVLALLFTSCGPNRRTKVIHSEINHQCSCVKCYRHGHCGRCH